MPFPSMPPKPWPLPPAPGTAPEILPETAGLHGHDGKVPQLTPDQTRGREKNDKFGRKKEPFVLWFGGLVVFLGGGFLLLLLFICGVVVFVGGRRWVFVVQP